MYGTTTHRLLSYSLPAAGYVADGSVNISLWPGPTFRPVQLKLHHRPPYSQWAHEEVT